MAVKGEFFFGNEFGSNLGAAGWGNKDTVTNPSYSDVDTVTNPSYSDVDAVTNPTWTDVDT